MTYPNVRHTSPHLFPEPFLLLFYPNHTTSSSFSSPSSTINITIISTSIITAIQYING